MSSVKFTVDIHRVNNEVNVYHVAHNKEEAWSILQSVDHYRYIND